MVASLIEAFGSIDPNCKHCSSRKNVIDWDNLDNNSSIPSSRDECNQSIFYSDKLK